MSVQIVREGHGMATDHLLGWFRMMPPEPARQRH
ncbi:hypothetical protein MHY1_p00141 (plasmid) [Methylovirgula sp. HY1]|nr:hypothetical protein MHY1_p00141 [Methylovirgula sp. HY1]